MSTVLHSWKSRSHAASASASAKEELRRETSKPRPQEARESLIFEGQELLTMDLVSERPTIFWDFFVVKWCKMEMYFVPVFLRFRCYHQCENIVAGFDFGQNTVCAFFIFPREYLQKTSECVRVIITTGVSRKSQNHPKPSWFYWLHSKYQGNLSRQFASKAESRGTWNSHWRLIARQGVMA